MNLIDGTFLEQHILQLLSHLYCMDIKATKSPHDLFSLLCCHSCFVYDKVDFLFCVNIYILFVGRKLRGHQMAAVITDDDVYNDAEMNGAPPAGRENELHLPGQEGNIQGQVSTYTFVACIYIAEMTSCVIAIYEASK